MHSGLITVTSNDSCIRFCLHEILLQTFSESHKQQLTHRPTHATVSRLQVPTFHSVIWEWEEEKRRKTHVFKFFESFPEFDPFDWTPDGEVKKTGVWIRYVVLFNNRHSSPNNRYKTDIKSKRLRQQKCEPRGTPIINGSTILKGLFRWSYECELNSVGLGYGPAVDFRVKSKLQVTWKADNLTTLATISFSTRNLAYCH